MKKQKILYLGLIVIAIIVINSNISKAQTRSQSVIAGFISIDAGNFSLSYPTISAPGEYGWQDYGFDDVYGSKNGLAFGGEVGIGLGDIGLFGILKYKIWKKKGHPVEFGGISFNGDTEWNQNFSSIGARYYFVKQTQTNKKLLPFLGIGITRSTVTETMQGIATFLGESEYVDISAEIDGIGVYLEAGADIYLSQVLSLRGMLEYASLNLGTSVYGSRVEIDGGGGLYIGIALNAFFGYQMKTITGTLTK